MLREGFVGLKNIWLFHNCYTIDSRTFFQKESQRISQISSQIKTEICSNWGKQRGSESVRNSSYNMKKFLYDIPYWQ